MQMLLDNANMNKGYLSIFICINILILQVKVNGGVT